MAKTLRSRIAAVAVAAVGAGMLVATPALATAGTTKPFGVTASEYAPADSYDTTVSVSQVAGANNFVEFTAGSDTAAGLPIVTVDGGTIVQKTDATGRAAGTLSADAKTLSYASNDLYDSSGDPVVVTQNVFRVGTPAAGTITVKVALRTYSAGVATDTTLQTFTITVGASAVKNVPVASKSTSILNLGAAGAAAADETVTVSSATGADPVADIKVTVKDANGVATTKSVSATIAGPGTLGSTDTNTTYNAASVGRALTQTTSDGIVNFSVWADGTSGVATITITSNGTTIATETVTFYGKPASVTATALKSNVRVASVTGHTAPTQYVSVVVKDANGVAIPSLANLVAKSSSTATATVGTPSWSTADEVYYVAVTSVATGSTTVTVYDSTETYSGSVALKVTKAVASTVSVELDKASYARGEKVTLTVTAKDSNGEAVADGTYTGFFASAATTSTSLTDVIFTDGTVKFTNGVGTATFYAPISGGTFTISLKTSTAATVATAAQGLALTATGKVVEDTTAIDAAKAAADAAKAEAAKATAAVAALSTTLTAVQTAMTALVASITSTMTLVQAQIAKIMAKLKIK